MIQPTVIELLDRYKADCQSVLHIRAHLAEYASLYREKGVSKATFIEGDPENFQEMMSVLEQYPEYLGLLALLCNEKTISEFYAATNLGLSSSILAPGSHLIERPDIEFL